jgi:hypothetical protein
MQSGTGCYSYLVVGVQEKKDKGPMKPEPKKDDL